MHENTQWLMDWADRMNEKFGPPEDDFDWCRKLAYFVDEAGNDHPSNYAISVAKIWERKVRKIESQVIPMRKER